MADSRLPPPPARAPSPNASPNLGRHARPRPVPSSPSVDAAGPASLSPCQPSKEAAASREPTSQTPNGSPAPSLASPEALFLPKDGSDSEAPAFPKVGPRLASPPLDSPASPEPPFPKMPPRAAQEGPHVSSPLASVRRQEASSLPLRLASPVPSRRQAEKEAAREAAAAVVVINVDGLPPSAPLDLGPSGRASRASISSEDAGGLLGNSYHDP